MRRWTATGLAAAFVVSSILYAPPAQAADCTEPVLIGGLPVCLEVVDGQAVVTLNGETILTATVPPVVEEVVKEVPVYIDVPGPPVEIPVEIPVEVPGPTQIIERTVEVPGPTRTIEVPVPAPAPETVTVTPQVTTPPARPTTGQESNPSATIAATPVERVERVIRLTMTQVVGYSLLAIAAGMLTTLIGLYVMFHLGRKEGERSLDDFVEELRNLTLIRKR